ncbi:MAG: hypothetical protein WBX20_07340 [Terrimicrobiaceae bacterium]
MLTPDEEDDLNRLRANGYEYAVKTLLVINRGGAAFSGYEGESVQEVGRC